MDRSAFRPERKTKRRPRSPGPGCRALIALPGLLALLSLPFPLSLGAQDEQHRIGIEGEVRDAESGDPLAGAIVSIVGPGTMATTRGDGTFHLIGVAPGRYHLHVERLGYRGATAAVQLVGTHAVVDFELAASPIPLHEMVVTATLSERGALEALRPVSVMAGDELQRQMAETVGETLMSLPGLSAATMGPAVAQPMIRGLGGDRVMLLEDGVGVSDALSSGSDHITALDPSAARRIEVVRGAASLLYGGNALGGVVNVIRDEIPTSVPRRLTGSATLQSQTATGAIGGSAVAVFGLGEAAPLRIELGARTHGDLKTPLGSLQGTDGRRLSGSVGSSWSAGWGHVGASVRGYLNHYGIPGGFVGGHQSGVRIEAGRLATKLQAVIREPFGPLDELRIDATHSWYEHREMEAANILGTLYRRQIVGGDLLGRHGEWGPFAAGAIGARLSWENLGYGGNIDTPDSDRGKAALYFMQEMNAGPFRFEWGLRYDWTGLDPLYENPNSDIGQVRDRSFHGLSGSLGALMRTGAGFSVGASLVQAFRVPDVVELYSEGPHLAAYVFEVGNPSLEGEVGRGADLFLRYESERLRGELTGFYNDVRNYVYGEETGRLSRVLLPVYQFRGNDARFRGFEAAIDADLGGGLALDAVASTVRGSLRDNGDPLPLIPPLRGSFALKYERPLWFVRGEAEMAAPQERIGEFETATNGYEVLNLSTGLRLTLGGRLHLITLSLENALDTAYRNHLSRVKEIMPEAGRGLNINWRVVY